jgi:hypothetical protein
LLLKSDKNIPNKIPTGVKKEKIRINFINKFLSVFALLKETP